MSNFQPTVGRSVQYIDAKGALNAALITAVHSNQSVDLVVFTSSFTDEPSSVKFVQSVPAYVDTFDARKRPQPNSYLLHWNGR